jgi:hypothetical protein
LFRQAFVDCEGHCSFTVAENVASVEAMDQRLETGRWANLAKTDVLQENAESMDLNGAAFVDFRPGEFINDRAWNGR